MMEPYAAVVGVGKTKFGELFDRGYMSLVLEAGSNALNDANLHGKDINAFYIGSFVPELTDDQGLMSSYLAEELGINKPVIRVEAACASGGLAIYEACLGIKSGKYDIVAVGGAEKLTNKDATTLLNTAMSEWERLYRYNFPAVYAAIANRHMHDFGTTREQLAMVAVKNHKHAKNNRYAHFRNQIKIEDVLNSPMVSHPLRLYDSSPVSDGAAVVILCKLELAKKFENPVYITGSAYATDTIGLYARDDITSIKATSLAAKDALKQSGKGLKDIDLVEVHDCFTIEEILAMEDMGFCKKGSGGKIIENSFDEKAERIVYQTEHGEKIVNAGGGLKTHGHPVGATGVRQIGECCEQLTGKSEYPIDKTLGRQPRVALAHNIGGSGAAAIVHVLEVL